MYGVIALQHIYSGAGGGGEVSENFVSNRYPPVKSTRLCLTSAE